MSRPARRVELRGPLAEGEDGSVAVGECGVGLTSPVVYSADT